MVSNLIDTNNVLQYLISHETGLSFNSKPLTKGGIFREPEYAQFAK
jgi:hypothetical protein